MAYHKRKKARTRSRSRGRFTNKIKVVFQKGRRTWTKFFKSRASAKRAVRGLQSKTNWKATRTSVRGLNR